MPNIPWFRDWFEETFGHLCELHDEGYDKGTCKICYDLIFFKEMVKIKKRYVFVAILTFLAVQAPWVWIEWYNNK